MKKILLISNKVMHYRIRIYNAFFDMWKQMGYEFHVVSNEYQTVDIDISFIKHELPFGSRRYVRFIKSLKPDIVINFLHLKDKMIIPLTLYCRMHGIPMIYWNHGINIKDPDNKVKNLIFHFIHDISSAIILYSPAQKKYIPHRDLKKTFIAYNTLSFSSSDEFRKIMTTKEEIKSKYGIKEQKILLYISRILPYKGLDLLLENFRNIDNLALVVVGGGISDSQQNMIDETPNYYYLGEKYGNDVDEIYSIGDMFSTPGHIGLAVNQAFYWGIPIFVLNRIHAPEICYLHNGVNGFMFDTMEKLREKVISLAQDNRALEILSQNARKTYEEEMSISNMFEGFVNAISYVSRNQ